MHVTGEISLGSIAIAITIIGAMIRIGQQIGKMQQLVTSQGTLIEGHRKRLDTYEERLVSVVGDVQRIVGRLEATQDRIERATGTRRGERGRSSGE